VLTSVWLNRIQRNTGWVLLLMPAIIFEGIGATLMLSGNLLIGRYLLQIPPFNNNHPVTLAVSLSFSVLGWFFLRPVFRLQKQYFDWQHGNITLAPNAADLQRARNRIFNYPLFLIASSYLVWTIDISLFYHFNRFTAPAGPVVAIGIIVSVLTAVLCYYATEMVTRFYFIPHWFPEGRITVTWSIFRRPSLAQRFLDLFLVNAFLPAVSATGMVFLALRYGPGDAEILERLLFSIGAISLAYWAFGFPLAVITASTIITPIVDLAKAAECISRDDFNIRLKVHSDDQLGQLQNTMNRIGRELAEKAKMKTLFGHYVSPVVRDLILSGRINTDGEKVEAVVLFSDIRSFTSLTENHPAEKIVEMLNVHFSRMVSAISDNQGFVDKFIGDAVMAVFDAEFCTGQHRLLAFNAVTQILQGMRETNRRMQQMGLPAIDIGLGMACGDVIRGNIGAPERKELTVIGDTVNLAARLEAMTKSVGRTVVASRNSIQADIEGLPGIDLTDLPPVEVRGKRQAVDVVAFSLRAI
jgi:class 3 adenylate cyclase